MHQPVAPLARLPFDPFKQTLTLLLPDEAPYNISMTDIDDYAGYGIRICINYSSQIGASFVLLIVLLLLTRKEKRGSPIFILNALSLVFNTIRSILQCLYFTGPFYESYAYFSGDYLLVPESQYNLSIAGDAMTFFVLICVECSLVLQTHAVCKTIQDKYRYFILLLTSAVAMTAIGFRFALTVENSLAIKATAGFHDYEWLAAASNYVVTSSICFYTAVFITKLGFALHQRKKLGLRQFGPMQVIFIMGCQTLLIPAIFSVLENFTSVPELGSQVLTILAIFLPLSSIWASASIPPPATSLSSDYSHRKLVGSYNSGSSGNETEKHLTPPLAGVYINKATTSSKVGVSEAERDLEAEGLKNVVHSFDAVGTKEMH